MGEEVVAGQLLTTQALWCHWRMSLWQMIPWCLWRMVPKTWLGQRTPKLQIFFAPKARKANQNLILRRRGGWKRQGATYQTLSQTPGSMVEEARNRQLTQFPSWMSPISSMR